MVSKTKNSRDMMFVSGSTHSHYKNPSSTSAFPPAIIYDDSNRNSLIIGDLKMNNSILTHDLPSAAKPRHSVRSSA